MKVQRAHCRTCGVVFETRTTLIDTCAGRCPYCNGRLADGGAMRDLPVKIMNPPTLYTQNPGSPEHKLFGVL